MNTGQRVEIKQGVSLFGVHPVVIATIIPAQDVMWEVAQRHLVITSAWDGKHRADSFHYWGMALDLRSWHIPTVAMKHEIYVRLKEKLGPGFDVLPYDHAKVEHFHIEWEGGRSMRRSWQQRVFSANAV